MKKFFTTVLKAGLVVGTLDIIAACVQAYLKSKTTPEQVLKYIASGAFGKEAFTDDSTMAVWGLLFHFLIAMLFTLFFFMVVARAPALVRYPIVTGIFYGVFAWATMRFIVLPFLSQIKPRPVVLKDAVIAAGILVVCIGIPLAYWAKSMLKTR